jgi:DNA invertase Pin-like site-specific DNA recombinase
MTMRRIDRDQFAAAHHQGMTRNDLAEHFGISRDAVTRIRQELGLPLDKPARRHKAPTIDRQRVKALVEDGWPNTEIAKLLDCHVDSISRIRNELGISHHYRGRTMTPERLARIAGMIADGWPHREITRTEGATPETLNKYFPGTAWTPQQTAEHISALRAVSHFNRRPSSYDRSKYPSAA